LITRAILLLLLLCLATAAPAPAQESLRSVERRIQRAWNSVSSLTATVKMESFIPAGPQQVIARGEGQLEYVKAQPKAKYRQRMEISVPEPVNMQASFEFLFDGTAMYLINEMMDQVTIAKADAPDFEKGALPPGGSPLLDALRAELDLGPHPDVEIDGRAMTVIEGKRRAKDAADPVQRALFYIDKENGIQRRAEFFTADGTLNTRIDYENFKLNLPISESRFVYDGPLPPEAAPEAEPVEDTPVPPVQVP